MNYAITIKTHGCEVRSLRNKHGATVERWRSKPNAYPRDLLRNGPAQTVETIANGSHRLNYRNQKRSEHVFGCVAIFNSRKPKTAGSRKDSHYDDSEIKAILTRAQLVERERNMRLRYGQKLSERDRAATKVLYKSP